MRFRVIVLLEGGSYTSVYFDGKSEASAFVDNWAVNVNESVGRGENGILSGVIKVTDPEGCVVGANLLSKIISMYIVEEKGDLSPQEMQAQSAKKMADILERQARREDQGNEWKGDES